MIEVVRGSDADLRVYIAEAVLRSTPALVLACRPGASRSWHGTRELLHQLTLHLGERTVEVGLRRHRVAASLLVDRLTAELAPEELARRTKLSADLTSHLSHNWAIQRPLFDAWAEILVELLSAERLAVAVTNLSLLDWETTAVLKSVYRQFPDRAPQLILGVDLDQEAETDTNGILWRVRPDYVVATVLGFQTLPEATTTDLEAAETRGEGVQEAPLGPGDRFVDAVEERAFRLLEAPAGALDRRDTRAIVEAMRSSFQRFGFTSCLRLGVDLLAAQPDLEPQQAAEVHGIIGLSAHNRQFRTAGNLVLAEFLERHFRAALASESRPAKRCALLYRLAVTAGRRRGEFESAQAWADQAVAEAQAADLPPVRAAHLEAWGRNIRAFVLLRSKRTEDGIADSEAAFALLERHRSELPGEPPYLGDVWPREYVATQALLAYNLSALHALNRNAEGFAHWQQAAHDLEVGYPGVERFDAGNWISYFRARLRLDLALDKALRGVDSARAENDAYHQYRFLIHAADLHYRIGNPLAAYELYQQELSLRERFQHRGYAFPTDLHRAAAAYRAGLFDPMRSILQQARSQERYESTEAQAELLAQLGTAAAASGDRDQATHWMDQGIERAVESGERDVLLRVITAAGEACQLLGLGDEAALAFQQGMEIAAAGEESPPIPADLLRVLLGDLECGGGGPESAVRALKALPAALQVAETWWHFPRLLRILTSQARRSPDLFAPTDLARPLKVLVEATGQRQDCAPALKDFLATLGAESTPALAAPAELST